MPALPDGMPHHSHNAEVRPFSGSFDVHVAPELKSGAYPLISSCSERMDGAAFGASLSTGSWADLGNDSPSAHYV